MIRLEFVNVYKSRIISIFLVNTSDIVIILVTRIFPPSGKFPAEGSWLCEICRWREPVPTRVTNHLLHRQIPKNVLTTFDSWFLKFMSRNGPCLKEWHADHPPKVTKKNLVPKDAQCSETYAKKIRFFWIFSVYKNSRNLERVLVIPVTNLHRVQVKKPFPSNSKISNFL